MEDSQLSILRQYLLDNLGLNFTENRNKELYEKMGVASVAFGFTDVRKFISWLVSRKLNNSQIEKLASFLTIGETYFQRERKALDYLEYEYLPKLIHERKGKHQYLKIWSAGCSSGEEPYSIAIMLKRLIPNLGDWNITIKATDINPNFLAKAKKGAYTEWSFRGIDNSFKTKYFKRNAKGNYVINTDIKEMVDFSFLNLISDDFSSPENNISSYDVILCRNVMIYFSNEGINSVTSRFYDSLTKGGVLLLSPVESTHLICNKFNKTLKDSVTIYSKTDILCNSRTVVNITNAYNSNRNVYFSDNKSRERATATAERTLKTLMPQVNTKSSIYKKKKEINCISLKKEIGNDEVSFDTLVKKYKSGNTDFIEDKLKNINAEAKDHRSLLLLAKIKLDNMELIEAERLCVQVINMDKINADAYYILGNVQYENDRVEDAIVSLKKSIFLDADNALCHYLLGNIYISLGNSIESDRCFKVVKRILLTLGSDESLCKYDTITAETLKDLLVAYMK